MTDAIRTENLKKSYGNTEALKGIDIQVKSGSLCGLIGPNGAGKSTLIRILMGLVQKDAGTVQINGKIPTNKTRSTIGYMPATDPFPKNLTAKDLFKLTARLFHTDTERAQVLSDRLHLDTGKKMGALSLGNAKKAAFICALAHEPDLLILDEPTSGLDPLVQKEIYEILQEEHKKGTTILFSSHNLNEVQTLCDTLICIDRGSILYQGKTEALFETAVRQIRTTKDGKTETWLSKSSMTSLLKELETMDPDDVEITKPPLETIFFELIGKEKDHAGPAI